MSLKINTYSIAILCLLAWDSLLFAQEKTMYMERFTQLNSELQSTNPSLLGIVTDSILLNVNSYYNYGKGDFVNYYSPDQYYNAGLSTQSYNRLNNNNSGAWLCLLCLL